MILQAMKQALEALESFAAEPPGKRVLHPEAIAITALRTAIEQAEKAEPAAWMHPSGGILRSLSCGLERDTYTIPPYTHPPQSPVGDVVITTTESGECVAVTRQDKEGRILKVIWEKGSPPDGWQLVPVEPTYEMLLAAEYVKQFDASTSRLRWEAMLAAAPKEKS